MSEEPTRQRSRRMDRSQLERDIRDELDAMFRENPPPTFSPLPSSKMLASKHVCLGNHLQRETSFLLGVVSFLSPHEIQNVFLCNKTLHNTQTTKVQTALLESICTTFSLSQDAADAIFSDWNQEKRIAWMRCFIWLDNRLTSRGTDDDNKVHRALLAEQIISSAFNTSPLRFLDHGFSTDSPKKASSKNVFPSMKMVTSPNAAVPVLPGDISLSPLSNDLQEEWDESVVGEEYLDGMIHPGNMSEYRWLLQGGDNHGGFLIAYLQKAQRLYQYNNGFGQTDNLHSLPYVSFGHLLCIEPLVCIDMAPFLEHQINMLAWLVSHGLLANSLMIERIRRKMIPLLHDIVA